jgi:integrin alpha FG-GAP repeat containing protein 1
MKVINWLLIGLLPTVTIAQTFQYGQRFPNNKLYNLEPDTIGLDGIDGTVAAFGDFNGDKL